MDERTLFALAIVNLFIVFLLIVLALKFTKPGREFIKHIRYTIHRLCKGRGKKKYPDTDMYKDIFIIPKLRPPRHANSIENILLQPIRDDIPCGHYPRDKRSVLGAGVMRDVVYQGDQIDNLQKSTTLKKWGRRPRALTIETHDISTLNKSSPSPDKSVRSWSLTSDDLPSPGASSIGGSLYHGLLTSTISINSNDTAVSLIDESTMKRAQTNIRARPNDNQFGVDVTPEFQVAKSDVQGRSVHRLLSWQISQQSNDGMDNNELAIGELNLTLVYSRGRLRIQIISIKNLKVPPEFRDGGHKVYKFVKGYLMPGKLYRFKTNVNFLPDEEEIIFKERFKSQTLTRNCLNKCSLHLHVGVYTHSSEKHFIGMAEIQLRDLEMCMDTSLSLDVCEYHNTTNDLGYLHISAVYQPMVGRVWFLLARAKRLPKMSLIGVVNPYVKVEMYIGTVKCATARTKHLIGVEKATWNEQIHFNVSKENPKLLGTTFVFKVVHKDLIQGRKHIGQVTLGWKTVGEELDYWKQIIASPHRHMTKWLPIKPPTP